MERYRQTFGVKVNARKTGDLSRGGQFPTCCGEFLSYDGGMRGDGLESREEHDDDHDEMNGGCWGRAGGGDGGGGGLQRGQVVVDEYHRTTFAIIIVIYIMYICRKELLSLRLETRGSV